MLVEINEDFYCSADRYHSHGFCLGADCTCCESFTCPSYHRKHPTPAEYKEEYGEEYPSDGAVYYLNEMPRPYWEIGEYSMCLLSHDSTCVIVCACTPFGTPDRNWRPW